MSFLGRDLARRLGIWALIQALPGEAELKFYLRAAYLGLAAVIVASVLTGSALAAGLVVAYRLLVQQPGWEEWQALLVSLGTGVVIVLACFLMAGRWFTRLAEVKHRTSAFNDVGRDLLSGAFNTLVEGFLAGMEERREERAREEEKEEEEARQEEWRAAKRKKSPKS
ncbi:MAG: hypothetical protein WDN72_04325 [Alphaproteobacteria bacterium]